MKGFSRLLVVGVTTATFLLLAAVGASAANGTIGSPKAVKSVVSLVAPNVGMVAPNAVNTGESKAEKDKDDNGKHKGQCHPPKKHHKHGTPGHKKHPCGKDGDDDGDDD
jgi:hypothetical protein